MIDLLKANGYDLPPREIDYSNITVKEIMDKISEFMRNSKTEEMIPDFWQLMADYPISMCQRKMSPNLTLLITLYYHYKVPHLKRKTKQLQELWDGVRERVNKEGFFSYGHLALLFMRSKSSISDAIKAREAEVRRITQEVNMRREARSIALHELIQQEKKVLLDK